MEALSPPADAVSYDSGVPCTGDRDSRPLKFPTSISGISRISRISGISDSISDSAYNAKTGKFADSSVKFPKQASRLWMDKGLFWENLEPVPMGDNGASRFAQQLVWDFKVSSLKRSTSTGFCPQVCRFASLGAWWRTPGEQPTP